MVARFACEACMNSTPHTQGTANHHYSVSFTTIGDPAYGHARRALVRPPDGPEHILIDRCRFDDGGVGVARRAKKQEGQGAGVGPGGGPAIPAAVVADGDPIIDDNLDLDRDIEQDSRVVTEDEALGVLRGDGAVVTEEGK